MFLQMQSDELPPCFNLVEQLVADFQVWVEHLLKSEEAFMFHSVPATSQMTRPISPLAQQWSYENNIYETEQGCDDALPLG